MRGQANLPTFAAQRAHVLSSVHQKLASLREVVGQPAVRAVERELDERCFMLGFLDRHLTEKNRGPVREMLRLLDFCESAIESETLTEVCPVYMTRRAWFWLFKRRRPIFTAADAILVANGILPGLQKLKIQPKTVEEWYRPISALGHRGTSMIAPDRVVRPWQPFVKSYGVRRSLLPQLHLAATTPDRVIRLLSTDVVN